MRQERVAPGERKYACCLIGWKTDTDEGEVDLPMLEGRFDGETVARGWGKEYGGFTLS